MFIATLHSIGETRMKLELAIIGLVSLVLFSSIPTDGAQSNMSISIGGHTFTTRLDNNWTANQANVIDYNPQKYFTDSRSRFGMTNQGDGGNASADPVPKYAIDWTGTQAVSAFSYKTKQSPESIAKYGLTKYGFVDIRVLKLTNDYIEAYGPSPDDTLSHATDLFSGRVIDTEFNGKPAMKSRDNDDSHSVIAFLLDNTTVALVNVQLKHIGISAQDIINQMTVD